MFDKYLRIGLGLGSVCAVSSIVYWSTQYNSHLPQFNVKPALTAAQKGRINSPSYQKILKAEEEVGCKFYLVLDNTVTDKKAYNLLREQEIKDEMIEKLAKNIESDRTVIKDTNLSIKNMKDKCTQWRRLDNKLRIVMTETKTEGEEKRYEFQVKTNDQGRGYSYEE